MIKKTFLHDRKINKRFRLNGDSESSRKPQKECLNKDFSKYVAYTASQLPPKVDLRPWMTKIEDQSDINSWYVKYLRIWISIIYSFHIHITLLRKYRVWVSMTVWASIDDWQHYIYLTLRHPNLTPFDKGVRGP